MATSTLRPLTVGEILDAAASVVTHHWKPLLGSLLLISTPLWVLFMLLVASVDPTIFQVVPEDSTTTEDPSGNAVAGMLVLLLLLLVVFLVSFVAVFKGVCDAWMGRQPSMGRSLGFGARRAGWVFLLSLLWIPSITVFSFFCGIPAFWLGTVWCLSIPAMLFEGIGPFKALGRSFSLIRGRFWEALIVVIVIVLVYQVLVNVWSLPIVAVAAIAGGDNGVTNAIAYGVAGLLGSVVSVPYMAALLTILYFDQRVRKEGFDIQVLAGGEVLDDPNATLPAPLVAPAGWVMPPPPPPPQGWQSPGGWVGPNAADAPPLRWGPAAEAPPSQSPGGWTPPAGEPSPWMAPGGASPPAAPTDGAPPDLADDSPTAPTDGAPPDLADDSPTAPMGDAPPAPADDAPPAPSADSPADPTADSPPADDAPSPWMSEEEPKPGWSPTPWKPTEWKPQPRKDSDEEPPEGQGER